MKINEERARQEMKRVDYLLRDSQMSNEVWELVKVLSVSSFELTELLAVYRNVELLDAYFRGHINIYDVMISIVKKSEEKE